MADSLTSGLTGFQAAGWWAAPTRAMVFLLIAVGAAACADAPSSDQPAFRRYALVGTVVSVDAARKQLTIAHEAIDGFMPAMTMPFKVDAIPAGAAPGVRVAGTLVVRANASWIESIEVTRPAVQSQVPPAANGPRAAVGMPMIDFSLTNQDGRLVGIRDLEGHVVLLTFIYTRCPLPEFCPLMMKNFEAVRRTLRAEPAVWSHVRLMSVTLDPVHDTPAALRAYGATVIKGPDPFGGWDLLTGGAGEIQRLTSYFSLTSRTEAGVLNHSLQTAIVDSRGRVAKLLPENWWRPEDVAAEVRRLVAAASSPGPS